METLFSQLIEFSTILPFKNYSNIASKIEYINIDIETGGITDGLIFKKDELLDDDPFLDLTTLKVVSRNRNSLGKGSIYLDRPKKKRGKYFYLSAGDEDDVEARLQIDLDFAIPGEKNSFTSTKQRHINRHFANPFSSINIQRFERSIIKRDNKITIKLYHRIKRREINWKFFKISTFIRSITIDTTTGNFTITEIANSKEKKIKKFRRNYFPSLLELMNHHGLFYMKGTSIDPDIKDVYEKIFDNVEFYNAINNVFGFSGHEGSYGSTGELLKIFENPYLVDIIQQKKQDFLLNFIIYFSKKKKIKIPDNNFMEFLVYYYPTEKHFKKNKRKLIASILDKYGIKSGVTVKLLHTNPTIDIITLVQLCKLFGDEYPKFIGNINPWNFDKIKLNPFSIDFNTLIKIQQFDSSRFSWLDLSDIEMENVVSIINSIAEGPKTNIRTFYGALMDHFNIIRKIRLYIPDIYLNARNYNDFYKEHSDYSKILSLINKPFVSEYVFDEKTVEEIEKKIQMIPFEKDYTDEDYLYPVLLKREEEYSEEGTHMHHCVGSYSDKDTSIIISLRTHDGTDRITSEFNIKSGECWQSRHFSNGNPPQKFEYALATLKNRVNALAKKNKLKWIDKRVVRAVINGIEIPNASIALIEQPRAVPAPLYEEMDLMW